MQNRRPLWPTSQSRSSGRFWSEAVARTTVVARGWPAASGRELSLNVRARPKTSAWCLACEALDEPRRVAGRYRVGTGHTEPTRDAGYTTAGNSSRKVKNRISLDLRESPCPRRLGASDWEVQELRTFRIWHRFSLDSADPMRSLPCTCSCTRDPGHASQSTAHSLPSPGPLIHTESQCCAKK